MFNITQYYDDVLGAVAQLSYTPANCVPGANQVTLFTGTNYSGQCVIKSAGSFTDPTALGIPNDSLSSILVGSGMQIELCVDTNYAGSCRWLRGNDADLNDISFDNVTSSAVIGAPCIPGNHLIAVFSEPNFMGFCSIESPGSYPTASIASTTKPIASVQFGTNIQKVVVYSSSNYGGTAVTLTGNTADVSTVGLNGVPLSTMVYPAYPDPGTGFTAEYYNNQTLSGAPSVVRIDQTVNFNWMRQQPDPWINPTQFSVRWTKVDTFNQGTYHFSVTADDGVKLYIDGNLVIDQWHDEGATTYTTNQTLSVGTHTIKMEYYQGVLDDVANLSYQQIG